MANKKLIVKRGGRYGTRMLQAGAAVTLDGPKARLFEALGWAEPQTRLPQLDHDGDNRPGGSAHVADPDIADLRAQYLARFGKKPFNGWPADVLREKLAAA